MTKALMTSSSRPQQLLARIIEAPDLVDIVQNLEAPVLSRLIKYIGLEDCSELVAFATTEQLRSIFDEDLWRSEKPGQDETFDAERFALWLQVMMEVGVELTARKLTELDEDLVTLAICKHVLVINIDQLTEQMSGSERSDEDDQTDKALESCLSAEFAEHQIIAKVQESWDAIIAVLVALDKDHHDFLARLLERCCHITTEYIDDNGGLFNVLTSEEMLESDVAADRENRREEQGHVAPSAAASFLSLAQVTPLDELLKSRTADPVSQAYFRSFKRGSKETTQAKVLPLPREQSEKVVRFLSSLREAEVIPEPVPHPLLAAGQQQDTRVDLLIKNAMRELRGRNPKAYGDRLQEFGYLANVLLSGCSLRGRAFRPVESADAAMAVCNLGLEHLLSDGATAGVEVSQPVFDEAVQALEVKHLVKLFQVGWNLLQHRVVLPATRQFQQLLVGKLHGLQDDQRAKDLTPLLATLKAALAAGKPWQSRALLVDVGDLLDRGTVLALKALLSEYPYLPRALSGASGLGRFISTARQLEEIQGFLKGLGRPAEKSPKKVPGVEEKQSRR